MLDLFLSQILPEYSTGIRLCEMNLALTWLLSGFFPFSFLDILPSLQEGLALGWRGHALGWHTAATMPILPTGQDHILLISPFLEAVNENLLACFWFLDLCPEHSNV